MQDSSYQHAPSRVPLWTSCFSPTVELVVSGCALPVRVMGLPRLRQLRPPPTDGRPGARQVHRSGFLSACGGRTAGESINGGSLEEREGFLGEAVKSLVAPGPFSDSAEARLVEDCFFVRRRRGRRASLHESMTAVLK